MGRLEKDKIIIGISNLEIILLKIIINYLKKQLKKKKINQLINILLNKYIINKSN